MTISSKIETIEEFPRVSQELADRAALKVCSMASSVEDARVLLGALGLLPEEQTDKDTYYELCMRQLHRLTPENVELGERGGRKCIACKDGRELPIRECLNGHKQTAGNIHIQPSGVVRCMLCSRLSDERAKQKRALNGGKKALKTKCVNGHRWTPETTMLKRNGHRQCTTCWKEQAARRLTS